MNYRKVILLIGILFTHFVSFNGRTWLGIKQDLAKADFETEDIFQLRKSEQDVSQTFDESLNRATDILDGLFNFEQFNVNNQYVNTFVHGNTALNKEKETCIGFLNEFSKRNPEVKDTISKYRDLDSSFANLESLYQNKFRDESIQFKYEIDFVCDQGMVDFITDKNGGFHHYLSGEKPTDILNPQYLDVYSVYDDETVDGNDEGKECLNSIPVNATFARTMAGGEAVVPLTEMLLNLGLVRVAIETIKNSLMSIKAAVMFWLPWVARLIIISAAIIALTIVFVVYWEQIKSIVDAIVDMFVSVAGEFASNIQEMFSSIISTANHSEGELAFAIDGRRQLFRALTTSYAKSLDNYGNKSYHRAIRSNSPSFIAAGFSEEYVYVCVENLTKEEAKRILQNNPKDSEFSNTYAFKRYKARSVMKLAFPSKTVVSDHNITGHGWYLYHFHAKSGNDKVPNHSFYGLPYYLDN